MNLSDPFPPEAIHWRAQTLTRDGTKALALAYLDARDVMDRFDAVCSPHGWEDSYIETASGRVISTIKVYSAAADRWIAKSDGAGSTAVEGEKGGMSDAFKRAGVKWGVGRYLYDLGNVWAPCDSYDSERKDKKGNPIYAWKAWKPEARVLFRNALDSLTGGERVFDARPDAPPTISEAQREKLSEYLNSLNFPTDRFLSVSKIKDLRDLPAAKFDGAMKWIADEAKKMETA